MFKQTTAFLAAGAALAAPLIVQARDVGGIEVSGYLKNETSVFTQSGQPTGAARKTTGSNADRHSSGDGLKFENSARVFLNGDMGENASWHADLNLVYDTKGINRNYRGHRNYTQYDYLRELYIDTSAGDWDVRIGKQQVVWGTADGIKLLDIVNPTDFRELNQNAFEDSRIPVWMINGERNIGERGNLQLIVSQAETNKFPGLWTMDNGDTRSTTQVDGSSPSGYSFAGNGSIRGRDRGQPFIVKGVDVITGGVNGFFNMGATFGAVTNTFGGANPFGANFIDPVGGLNPSEFGTVDGFVSGPNPLPPQCGLVGAANGPACLEALTEFTNQNVTNLIDVTIDPATGLGTGWNVTNPNSAWEHFPNASFATFNAMVGMNTRYRRDYDDDFLPSAANWGGRYRINFDNGLNLGVNYFYAYDPNPSLNLYWRSDTGERLVVDEVVTAPVGSPAVPPGGRAVKVLQIRNKAGTQYYGANADFSIPGLVDVSNANNGGPATLVFEEDRNRIHNLGSSFDYAFDIGVPVVLRGEFLYQKDVNQPVVNRGALADGNLVTGLKSEKQDFFKYVLGADFTVFTNLLISGQFIQFRNLDFVDKGCSFITQGGNKASCARYTGDAAVMNTTNGLRKGYKNKEYYSLFLSKPFGEAQLGRWNNILIYEEGGGWWNRFDAEYSITDQLVVGGELNYYWGDDDRTLFGQFKDSSNLQVSVKYIID